jgi:hypothetical protein
MKKTRTYNARSVKKSKVRKYRIMDPLTDDQIREISVQLKEIPVRIQNLEKLMQYQPVEGGEKIEDMKARYSEILQRIEEYRSYAMKDIKNPADVTLHVMFEYVLPSQQKELHDDIKKLHVETYVTSGLILGRQANMFARLFKKLSAELRQVNQLRYLSKTSGAPAATLRSAEELREGVKKAYDFVVALYDEKERQQDLVYRGRFPASWTDKDRKKYRENQLRRMFDEYLSDRIYSAMSEPVNSSAYVPKWLRDMYYATLKHLVELDKKFGYSKGSSSAAGFGQDFMVESIVSRASGNPSWLESLGERRLPSLGSKRSRAPSPQTSSRRARSRSPSRQ